jgi:hypothetical protein
MAKKVVYVPNPHPHPQAHGAPGTGVPVNPVAPKVAPVKHAKEVM